MVPVSELRDRQAEIIARLRDRPVILTEHGRAAALLIDPDLWNALIDELEDLQDAAIVAERREEYLCDPSVAEPWGDVEAELREKGSWMSDRWASSSVG